MNGKKETAKIGLWLAGKRIPFSGAQDFFAVQFFLSNILLEHAKDGRAQGQTTKRLKKWLKQQPFVWLRQNFPLIAPPLSVSLSFGGILMPFGAWNAAEFITPRKSVPLSNRTVLSVAVRWLAC